MRIGTSLALLAFGAILTFALTDDEVLGIDLGVVGIILMVVALVGLGMSFYYLQGQKKAGLTNADTDPDNAARTPAAGDEL
jgi:hypothetical protein